MPQRTEEERSKMDHFVNDWVKKILTFFVICSSIACIIGCVFVLKDAFSNEDDGGSGSGHDHERYSGSEKLAAVVNYLFWLVLSIVLFLVEWEPLWMFNYALFLHFWPGRGMMQIYLGIQIIHEAADMGKTKVFGLDGDTVKTLVKAMGWCFLGTGCLYVLLSCCCLRKKDGTDVVGKLRKGKGYEAQDSHQARTPAANLALLKKMHADGVAYLAQAIAELETCCAEEEKKRGVGGWFRKKFGGGDDDKKNGQRGQVARGMPEPPPGAETPGRSNERDETTPQRAYGTDVIERDEFGRPRKPSSAAGGAQSMGSAPTTTNEIAIAVAADDDDIRRRREEADRKLEEEYYARFNKQ